MVRFNMKRFKKYPNWKQKYSTTKIIKELVREFSNKILCPLKIIKFEPVIKLNYISI